MKAVVLVLGVLACCAAGGSLESWGVPQAEAQELATSFVEAEAQLQTADASGVTYYRATTCFGQTMTLSCASGTALDIAEVIYGRDNEKTCSPGRFTWSSCNDTNADAIVWSACQSKQSCSLVANSATFSEACGDELQPYLSVRYGCERINAPDNYACGGSTLHMSCAPNYLIQVTSAYYGRNSFHVCPVDGRTRAFGYNTVSTDVATACNHKPTCDVTALAASFKTKITVTNAPYLWANYNCKPQCLTHTCAAPDTPINDRTKQCVGSTCTRAECCQRMCNTHTCPTGYKNTEAVCRNFACDNGQCCTDINECQVDDNACGPNSNCVNTIGSYSCSCLSGYTGTPPKAPCTKTCSLYTCPRGYNKKGGNPTCPNNDCTTEVCCTDINECSARVSPCQRYADCANTAGSYTCTCQTGFYLSSGACLRTCSKHTCSGARNLVSTKSDYRCGAATCTDSQCCELKCSTQKCPSGTYTAKAAETIAPGLTWSIAACCDDVDECATQTDPCKGHATCKNTNGGFTCTCDANYVGTPPSAPCKPTCMTWTCKPGFSRVSSNPTCTTGTCSDSLCCRDVNECTETTNPCPPHSTCANTVGSYNCNCVANYYKAINDRCYAMCPTYACPGRDSRKSDYSTKKCGGETCTRDECCELRCNTFSCRAGYSNLGSKVCPDFACTHDNCCADVDECTTIKGICKPNSICTNTVGSYQCECIDDYAGSPPAVQCRPTCHTYTCPAGYSALNSNPTCTTGTCTTALCCSDVNECSATINPCPAHSSCSNTVGSYVCNCDAGYKKFDKICIVDFKATTTGTLPATSTNLLASGSPFGSGSLKGYCSDTGAGVDETLTGIHCYTNINDGQLGNGHSWISNGVAPAFVGVRTTSAITVTAFKFGRDQTGQYGDRIGGDHILEYSLDPLADHTTTLWYPAVTVNPPAKGSLYFLSPPLTATAFRIRNSDVSACIDELEMYGSVGGKKTDGDNDVEDASTTDTSNMLNVARYGTAFASGSLNGYCNNNGPATGGKAFSGKHCFKNINDGIFGNENSWISNGVAFNGAIFVGVALPAAATVQTFALGRDQKNTYNDRLGTTFYLEISTAANVNHQTTAWTTVAEFRLPTGRRQQFRLAAPVTATGFRLRTAEGGACIDELELFGSFDAEHHPTPDILYYSVKLTPNRGSQMANAEAIESSFKASATSAGYCLKVLDDLSKSSNHELCTGGVTKDIGQRFAITIFEPVGSKWYIQAFMDTGYGQALYVDGQYFDKRTGDIHGLTQWETNELAPGVHTLVFYGGEGCCDGNNGAWKFSRDGTTYQAITKDNLQAAGIPPTPSITYFSTSLKNQGSVGANRDAIADAYDFHISPKGYCYASLDSMFAHSNQVLCSGGSNKDIGQRIEITFYEPEGAEWQFQINMDSGFGYYVELDGVKVGELTGDVWTGSTNPKTYTLASVAKGKHRFVVYGGEGCCDGEAGQWQFQRAGLGFRALTTANLLHAQVEQPFPTLSYYSCNLANQGTPEKNKEVIEGKFATRTVTSGYCNKAVADLRFHENSRVCPGGANSNIGQRFGVTFFEPVGGDWTFKVYVDAGWGFAIFVDDKYFDKRTDDVWGKSGDNPTYWTLKNLSPGVHQFVLYGGEGCCDGQAGGWQFRRGLGPWQDLTKDALIAASKAVAPSITYFSTPLKNQGSVLGNRNAIEAATKVPAYLTPAGYCYVSLKNVNLHSNQRLCDKGSAQNIGQRFQITLEEPEGGAQWAFSINMDSGFGYLVEFDGTKVGEMTGDVWTSGTNPRTYTINAVAKGVHTFSVYGGEGCCDGEAGAWTYTRTGPKGSKTGAGDTTPKGLDTDSLQDIQICEGEPCGPNANCANSAGTRVCTCITNYVGTPPTDQCTASCITHTCATGFAAKVPAQRCAMSGCTTDKCCSDINECTASTNPCGPNSRCTNTIGSFGCACLANYAGTPPTDACTQTCYFHSCPTGYTRPSTTTRCPATGCTRDVCCQDIDECKQRTNPCGSHSICTNTPGSYTCSCETGYYREGSVCKPTCATFTCTANQYIPIDPTTKCGSTCSLATCCTKSCGSYTSCPSHQRIADAKTECPPSGCTAAICCADSIAKGFYNSALNNVLHQCYDGSFTTTDAYQVPQIPTGLPDMPETGFAYTFSARAAKAVTIGVFSRTDELQFEIVLGSNANTCILRATSGGAAIRSESCSFQANTVLGVYLAYDGDNIFVNFQDNMGYRWNRVINLPGKLAHRLKVKTGEASPATISNICQKWVPSIWYFSTAVSGQGTSAKSNKDAIESRYRSGDLGDLRGFCKRSLADLSLHSNFELCTDGALNRGQRFEINFAEPNGLAAWTFLIHLDAGAGYAAYLDGTFVKENNADVFTDGTAERIELSGVSQGMHSLVIYALDIDSDWEAGEWVAQRNGLGGDVLGVSSLFEIASHDRRTAINNVAQVYQTCESKTTNTPNAYNYISPGSFATSPNDGFAYFFKVKASNDAHVSVWSSANQIQFELVYGGWANKQSVVRETEQGANQATKSTSRLLSATTGRILGAAYDGTRVSMTTSTGKELLGWNVQGKYANAIKVSTGWGSTGVWSDVCQLRKAVGIYYFSSKLATTQRGNTFPMLHSNVDILEQKYRANDNGGAGYCSLSISAHSKHSNQRVCPGGSNRDIMQRVDITFFEPEDHASWYFTVQTDSHWGMSIQLDGATVYSDPYDVWTWRRSAAREFGLGVVGSGVHHFVAYTFEDCCDLESVGWEIHRNSGSWRALTTAQLKAYIPTD